MKDNIPNVSLFDANQLIKDHGKEVWYQFLKIPSLRSGMYVLPVGAEDTQNPHKEDEIYYVISGRGKLHVEGTADTQELLVYPSAILFVKAEAKHRFFEITEELQLLVFFSSAPA